ncbi:retrovirus-related pol polyprotein from transposon TNT 1-94 [Tanacetum coccineum]|uniref:Retrovirus-related pol polyprotein from transposon TNT 1-94 n=1 Tax=Tanacetum coccineum TaxID=301880 RepID=A0ABQ5DMB3_9ASTR
MLAKIRKTRSASDKAKKIVSTIGCLELVHMDLFGPSSVRSYGGNRYTLVIVDDYSRKRTLDYFRVFGSKCLSDLIFSGGGDTDGGSDDEGSATASSAMHASADGDRGVWC